MLDSMLNLCTGHYMNYYDLSGKIDLFIIINEGNGEATVPLDVEKLHEAEKICEKYVNDEYHIDRSVAKRMQDELENLFEYGVQVYFASEFEHMTR